MRAEATRNQCDKQKFQDEGIRFSDDEGAFRLDQGLLGSKKILPTIHLVPPVFSYVPLAQRAKELEDLKSGNI